MPDHPAPRRTVLKLAVGLGSATLLAGVAGPAAAAKNDAMRGAFKYQDTPNAGKQCSGCLQFVPGKAPADKGGCKVIAGDTEIAPTGWCAAFVPSKT